MAGMGELAAALAAEFGPEWRVGGPAGDGEVASFERTLAISLPEQYRAFVAQIANGAVGPPHYGLVPLGAPAGTNSYHVVRSGLLSRPFPLTKFGYLAVGMFVALAVLMAITWMSIRTR